MRKDRSTRLLDYQADMVDGQLRLWDFVKSSSYFSKLYFFVLCCENKVRNLKYLDQDWADFAVV